MAKVVLTQDANSGGTITNVTATAPITSTGGATPNISTSMNTNRLIGRTSSGAGVMQEITVGNGLTLSSANLSANPSESAFSYTATNQTNVSGTTANTISSSILIASNTLNQAKDYNFGFQARGIKIGTNGTFSFRVYANTSNNLTGATLIGGFATAGATTLWLQFSRQLAIRYVASNQMVMAFYPSGISGPTDDTSATSTASTFNFNQQNDLYLLVAVQLGNSADSARTTMQKLIVSVV